MLWVFASLCCLFMLNSFAAAQPLTLTNLQAVQINSIFFNISVTTNQITSLYAEYYPISGQYGKNITLRSVCTKNGFVHKIPIGRLYANTTYRYKLFQKTKKQVLVTSTFTTTLLPEAIRDTVISVNVPPTSSELVLVNLPDFSGAGNNYLYKWDDTGKIVWYLQDTNQFTVGFGMAEDDENLYVDATNKLRIYKPWGTLVKEVGTDGCPDFHHEMFLDTRNERYAWTMNIEMVYNGSSPVQIGETFIKWDTKLNTLEQVAKTTDFISINVRTPLSDLPFFGYIPCKNLSVLNPADWTHGNAIVRSPHHKKFMVYSARSLHAVFIFDKDFQNLLYTVGGPTSDFTFPNPNDVFTTQHTPQILRNKNNNNQHLKLLVFDNGIEHPTPHSRALLLKLDLNTMEATKIWDYRLSLNPNCLGNFTGSAYELEDGDFLVNFPTCAWNFAIPNTAYIVRLDKNGQQKWIYSQYKPNTFFNYRAQESGSVVGETEI